MDEDLTIAMLAAELNVPVEFAVGLAASGQIPSHQVDGETRVRRHDMVAFREAMHAAARAALVDLAQQARDLDLDSPRAGDAPPAPPADQEDEIALRIVAGIEAMRGMRWRDLDAHAGDLDADERSGPDPAQSGDEVETRVERMYQRMQEPGWGERMHRAFNTQPRVRLAEPQMDDATRWLLMTHYADMHIGPDAIEWAVQRVLAGHDGNALLILAGLPPDEDEDTIDRQWRAAMAAAGFEIPPREVAERWYLRWLAGQIAGSVADPMRDDETRTALGQLNGSWCHSFDPELGWAAEALEELNEPDAPPEPAWRDRVRQAAERFLRDTPGEGKGM